MSLEHREIDLGRLLIDADPNGVFRMASARFRSSGLLAFVLCWWRPLPGCRTLALQDLLYGYKSVAVGVKGLEIRLASLDYSAAGLGLTVHCSAAGLGLTVHYSAVGLRLAQAWTSSVENRPKARSFIKVNSARSSL